MPSETADVRVHHDSGSHAIPAARNRARPARYEPSAFEGRSSQFRVVAPVDLQFDGPQGQGSVSAGRDPDRRRWSWRAAAASSRFELPVDASFDVRYLPQSENTGDEREVEEDDLSDAFYRDDQIDLGQLMEEQFYLALPMKPLCREDCKGSVPELRHQPERRDVRLPGPLGRSPAGGPESADQPEQRRCLIQNDAIPRPAAASAARTTPCPSTTAGNCPQCGEPKAAARRVQLLRLLQRAPGSAGRRRIACQDQVSGSGSRQCQQVRSRAS